MTIADKLNGCTDDLTRVDIEEMTNQSQLDPKYNNYFKDSWFMRILFILETAAYICITFFFAIFFGCGIDKILSPKVVP